MRDSADFGLDRNDTDTLNSLRVEVRKDLSVRLRAGDTVIKHIPFKGDGMEHGLDKSFDNSWVFSTQLDRLSRATTFIGSRLFLSADSKVDLSVTSASDYFLEQGLLIVTYLPGVDEFEIKMANFDRLRFVRTKR
jgi:hypothetical protein